MLLSLAACAYLHAFFVYSAESGTNEEKAGLFENGGQLTKSLEAEQDKVPVDR